MHNTNYILRFVFLLTAVVAVLLALMFNALKPMHDRNEAVYNKRAILSAVENQLDQSIASMSDDDIQNLFETQVEQYVLDMSGNSLTIEDVESRGYRGGLGENVDLGKERKKPEEDRILPLFVYKGDDGKTYYITSVRGKGLWDEIWGYIALEDDFSTIAGVGFDHKAETPGLGAEIKDNAEWKRQFIGKRLFDDNEEFVSVGVIKGGARNIVHDVDGISGATITANGVAEMMKRGLAYYHPYFDKLKTQ